MTIKPGSPTPTEFRNNFNLSLLEERFPGVSSKTLDQLEEEFNLSMPYQNGNVPGFIEMNKSISNDNLVETGYSLWESRDAYMLACEQVNHPTDTTDVELTDFVSDYTLIETPYQYIKLLYALDHVEKLAFTYTEV